MEISFKQANSKNYIKGRTKGIEYIVLHYTGNFGDTAKNNADYFAREEIGKSAHYFCDETSVWNSVYDSDRAQHCGGDKQGSTGGAFFGKCTNGNSIGIEMCIYDKKGNIRQGTIETAIWLTKQLMATYGVKADKVIRHFDVTGKICPAPMVDDPSLWESFKAALTVAAPQVDGIISKNVRINGHNYTCDVILKNEQHFIKLADLKQAGFAVGYDGATGIPSLISPNTRAERPTMTAEVQAAADALQMACGLADQTIDYLLSYKYGDDLVKKLADQI